VPDSVSIETPQQVAYRYLGRREAKCKRRGERGGRWAQLQGKRRRTSGRSGAGAPTDDGHDMEYEHELPWDCGHTKQKNTTLASMRAT